MFTWSFKNKSSVEMQHINSSVKQIMANNRVDIINDAVNDILMDEPFYIVNLADVVEKYRTWKLKLPRVQPYYAVKTNSDMMILQLMSSLDVRFDCASKEEIELVLASGARPSDIIYAHPFKLCSYLQHAKFRGVDLMTFDTKGELLKIKQIYPTAKLVIRFNVPNVTADFPLNNKFGCDVEEISDLLELAKQLDLQVVGACFHVGGLCRNPYDYSRAIELASKVFRIAEGKGFKFTLLDLGGGYPGDSNFFDMFDKMCECINKSLKENFPDENEVQIIAEPGCYFVCSAFTLCTTIVGKKDVTLKENGIPKQKIMYYLNDGTYGSFPEMYECYGTYMWPLLSLSELHRRPLLPSKIWGCTCCSSDCISNECMLPEMKIGERIIFENMGAYTLSLASSFNGFLKPTVRYIYKSNKKHDAFKLFPARNEIPAVDIQDWKTISDKKRSFIENDDSNCDTLHFG